MYLFLSITHDPKKSSISVHFYKNLINLLGFAAIIGIYIVRAGKPSGGGMEFSCFGRRGGRLSFGGRRAASWLLLSEIRPPDSGTGPIHQKHMMCFRFRGPCPSDVKSAVHPESAA